MHSNDRPSFRFTMSALNRLSDACIPEYRYGTYASLWSNATMQTSTGACITIVGTDCWLLKWGIDVYNVFGL